ncbi:hypothetical protein ACEWY4_021908 [Coilia grayii]|uniref:Myb/SANT-like DNA-binding domain-containing protein n=1 Tax=Coilia grayii TaxID=363190 RepID=A0ABD1J6D1_9TELE
MANWTDTEIQALLSIRGDSNVMRQMHGTVKDSIVYHRITARLRGQGILKTKVQVNNKLKSLKRHYNRVVDHNNRHGCDDKVFPYFSQCDAIWGGHFRKQDQQLSSSTCGQHDDAYNIKGEYPDACDGLINDIKEETEDSDDVSMNGINERTQDTSNIMINGPCLSSEMIPTSSSLLPSKVKKVSQTRAGAFASEMKDMFTELERDLHERDQQMLLEQREHEERVRREAREDREKELSILQDLTTLLRQMSSPPHTSAAQPAPAESRPVSVTPPQNAAALEQPTPVSSLQNVVASSQPAPASSQPGPASPLCEKPAQVSPVFRFGQKRKRRGQYNCIVPQMALVAKQHPEDSDECTRFGQTVADMLRRVPETKRADVMFRLFQILHENRQEHDETVPT